MTDKINPNRIDPSLLAPIAGQGVRAVNTQPAGKAFGQILAEQIGRQDVKFSAHAQARIQSRNIAMGPNEIQRLNDAVDLAAAKGAKDSLVLMGGVALVVSVQNRTVITAVDGDSLKDNVFTNIDSAVIT